ncbi:MAG: EsaB/YukD family protein [Lachnospiraceae bacterium]|nr:EsaB/YukD family protein [Lachnospiraceae bacterium]
MILVDIYVPANGRQYDFRLDENAYTATIVDEIGKLLSPTGDVSDLLLCDYEAGQILPFDRTLKQLGIGNGKKLVLV